MQMQLPASGSAIIFRHFPYFIACKLYSTFKALKIAFEKDMQSELELYSALPKNDSPTINLQPKLKYIR